MNPHDYHGFDALGPRKNVDTTGYFVPWIPSLGEPLFLVSDRHPGHKMLPVFSTMEKLREEAHRWAMCPFEWTARQIDEHFAFLSTIPPENIMLAVDLHKVGEDNIGFNGILLSEVGRRPTACETN